MSGPSKSYYRALAATRQLHATRSKKFNGRFLVRYLPGIERLIRERGCRTLLDYGCGKAVQWERPMDDGKFLHERLGVTPTLFDPGVDRFAAEPRGQFDIVICTQVLGSVPVADLDWVVGRLLGLSAKALFIGERAMNKPLRKRLHDDMADQMPHGWRYEDWLALLQKHGAGDRTIMFETLNAEPGVARWTIWGDGWAESGQRSLLEDGQ